MKRLSFADELDAWLSTKGPKTFSTLEKVFGERSFAIIFLVFMALPALPIPTGGITHILEILTMLIALQPIAGLKKLWVPQFLSRRELPKSFTDKALPLLMRRVRWFEKYSRPRGEALTKNGMFSRFAGLCVLGLTLGAFLALPFSGLDTLPALGVVLIALAMIEDDISFFVIGLLVGLGGILLEYTVGAALIAAIKSFVRHTSPLQQLIAAIVAALLVAFLLVLHHKKKL